MSEPASVELSHAPAFLSPQGTIRPAHEVDYLLTQLGYSSTLQEIEANSALRHEATDATFAYLAGSSRLLEMGYPKADEEVAIATESIRTLLTLEVRNTHQDESDVAFATNAIRKIMSTDPDVKPTLVHATEQTVNMIEDNKLAATYLERMLRGDDPINKWSAVVDWRALEKFGMETVDIPFKMIDSYGRLHYAVHNADVNTLQGWSERFEDHAIGAEVDAILGEITEQLAFLISLEFRPIEAIEAAKTRGLAMHKLGV